MSSDPQARGGIHRASSLVRVREPWSIGPLRLRHRIVMGSMHTGLETKQDGGAALAAFYRERAAGGAALIITGGLAVDHAGRGGPDYAVLTDPGVQRRMSRVVAAVHDAGTPIAAQLFHAGRYAIMRGATDATGRQLTALAPSVVPWAAARGEEPRAMSADDIEVTIGSFADAARAAYDAGFDAVEVMASEGYLINQFCSPLTNLRDDEWGGDATRRRRFAVEVVRAVRAAVPESMPVLVRVSGDDLMPGSSTPAEIDALALALVDAGAAALNVGIGWHESRVPTVQAVVPKGAWVTRAARIRQAVDQRVPVIASNRITDLHQAEQVVADGCADAVSLARPFLADPSIVLKTFAGRDLEVNTCIGCDQACIDRSLVFQPISCLVNPRAGRETAFPRAGTRRPRAITVVGSGPAGLAAAVDLAERGHHVTVFEAHDEPGGQFRLAARVPGKEDYARTVDSALVRLARLGVSVTTGTTASVAALREADGVILATGVRPRRLELPGTGLPHVIGYERALTEGVPDGTVAIIGGGGIGVDVAAFLVETHRPETRARRFAAAHGGKGGPHLRQPDPTASWAGTRQGDAITILRRSGKIGHGIGITSRWVTVGALREAGVHMRTELRYRAITADGVEIEHVDGTAELVPADTVVVCAGQESFDPLSAELDAEGIRHIVVGGAREARELDAVRATSEALEAARELTRED